VKKAALIFSEAFMFLRCYAALLLLRCQWQYSFKPAASGQCRAGDGARVYGSLRQRRGTLMLILPAMMLKRALVQRETFAATAQNADAAPNVVAAA